MEDHDLRNVLDELFGAYARSAVPTRRMRDTWAPYVVDVDTRDARAAVAELVRTTGAPPSLARFLEACTVAARERRSAEHRRAHPTATPSEREVTARVAAGFAPSDDSVPIDEVLEQATDTQRRRYAEVLNGPRLAIVPGEPEQLELGP